MFVYGELRGQPGRSGVAEVTAGSCDADLGPDDCPMPGAHLAKLSGSPRSSPHLRHPDAGRPAGADHLDLEDDVVGVLTVDVVAARVPDAMKLAGLLHLTERRGHHDGEGPTVWRCWSGWVPAAERGLPVSLHVTAPLRA